jgi:hypothetical protein
MTPASGKSVKYDLRFMLVSHRPKLNLFTNSKRDCIPNFIEIDVIMSELKHVCISLLRMSHLCSGDVNAVLDIVKCVSCSPSLYSYFQVRDMGHDVHPSEKYLSKYPSLPLFKFMYVVYFNLLRFHTLSPGRAVVCGLQHLHLNLFVSL